jgi:hypothetical protein
MIKPTPTKSSPVKTNISAFTRNGVLIWDNSSSDAKSLKKPSVPATIKPKPNHFNSADDPIHGFKTTPRRLMYSLIAYPRRITLQELLVEKQARPDLAKPCSALFLRL